MGMRLLRIAPIVAAGLSTGLVALVLAQGYPPAFPRANATKLIDTERITVWDIVWPKGQPSPLHRHVYDQVGTYYQAGGRIITNLDGTKRSSTTAIGALSTTRRGTTHVEEGATDPPLGAVFIELKHDGPSGLRAAQGDVPIAFPRDGATPLLDDERVTVWDYTWSAGVRETMSLVDRDTIWVWLAPGTFRITPRGGPPGTSQVRAGEIRSLSRGAVEMGEAVDGSPRAMIFSFK